MSNIMKDFDEPGFLAPTGLFLGPTKYMVIQGEPGAVIRGKKVRADPPALSIASPRPPGRSISLPPDPNLLCRDLEALP
jgi:hypothetical protein